MNEKKVAFKVFFHIEALIVDIPQFNRQQIREFCTTYVNLKKIVRTECTFKRYPKKVENFFFPANFERFCMLNDQLIAQTNRIGKRAYNSKQL